MWLFARWTINKGGDLVRPDPSDDETVPSVWKGATLGLAAMIICLLAVMTAGPKEPNTRDFEQKIIKR